MYKTITTFLILLILMMTAISQAQTRSLNCGRFGMDVNSTGTLTDFQWPRDFIYANNGGGGGYDILIEDWNKPGGNQDGYAVPGDVEVGTWTTVYNVKRIKYPYPTIMVDGNDISSTDEYDGDPVPSLPADQMVETLVNSYVGVSLRQRVYAWSHPKYQDLALVHLQWINTGNTDADDEIELPDNSFSNFWFFEVNVFRPGNGSHDELCDRTHTKSDRADIYSNTQIWRWEGDNPNNPGEYDPSRPQLLHASVGNDPDNIWFNRNVDTEGDPKPETGEFMSPMYIGEGIIHLDKSTSDRSHDPTKHKLMLWDTYYWLYHGATGDRADRYRVFREGLEGEMFSEDNEHDDPDPLTGGQRGLASYGPWELAFGDTLNIVFFRGCAGVDINTVRQKGQEWLAWWETGEGTFDSGSKNALLRTGLDSLTQAYERAKNIWDNDLQLPEGWNPQPPQSLTVTNIDSNHIQIEWTAPNDGSGIQQYNLYAAIGSRNALYEPLATIEADPAQTEYTYTIRNPQPGFAYYFALTAMDENGNESSKYLCRTNRLAIQAGLAKGNEMDAIRVVPNPFVYDPDGIKNYPGEKDKLLFAGLPGDCVIRIYTLAGDLVDEIHHDDAFSGGQEFLTITKYRQFMASGVYVYHVESLEDKGEKIGKFILIR